MGEDGNHGINLPEAETRPYTYTTNPFETVPTPKTDLPEPKPNQSETITFPSETKPDQPETKPDQSQTKPNPSETKPNPSETKPIPSETKPDQSEPKPDQPESKPNPSETKPYPPNPKPKPNSSEIYPTESIENDSKPQSVSESTTKKSTTTTTEIPDYENKEDPQNLVIITIETGNDTMNADNLAKVTLKICPRNFSCCQTNVLDRLEVDDYTKDKSNLSGYFNEKKYLGKCHMDTFKVMDKNFIKSVEMSYKPTSKKNKDTWTPKEVNICFTNQNFKKGHIYQCDKLENLGPFGPGQTTKDLINCKWHKGTCFI